MNYRFAASCFGIVCLVGIHSTATLAQGTFSCSNIRLQNALITDCAGKPVGGTNYALELQVANPQTKKLDAAVLHVTATTNQPLGQMTVLNGRNAGRFFVGTILVPFVAPGADASVELRAWDRTTGATYDQATVRGSSAIKVRLGGAGQPPSMPGTMTQFTGIKLCPATGSEK